MRLLLLLLMLLLVSCGNDLSALQEMIGRGELPVTNEQQSAMPFSLKAYDTTGQRAVSIWATYYYIPRFIAMESGVEIRAVDGSSFGIYLTHHDWCFGALEGTFQVVVGQRVETFNFNRLVGNSTVNCSSYFTYNVGASRFHRAVGPYGDGVAGKELVPYRTIAVDRSVFPIGTILYIPAARGVVITLPDGRQIQHDGYFYAADVGGGIHGRHVDVFLGINSNNPFAWIKSRESASSTAYIVEDQEIRAYLEQLVEQ